PDGRVAGVAGAAIDPAGAGVEVGVAGSDVDGAPRAWPPAVATTVKLCAGTRAVSARSLSRFHQVNVIGGNVSLPGRRGTTVNVRRRVPFSQCPSWPVSSSVGSG